MKMTKLLLVVLVFLSVVSVSNAEEKKLGVAFDLTYASRWLSDGAEVYSEDGAFHETLSFDLFGSGFGFSVTHHSATDGGWVDKQRLDYKVFYGNSVFDDSAYKTKYKVSWEYWNFYDRAKARGDIQKFKLALSWPEFFGNGLVPKYAIAYCNAAGRGYDNRKYAGFLHIFGVDYSFDVEPLPSPIKLSANVTYRDGAGGAGKDHDWSHATLGISTKFKISDKLSFVPGIYHQISMDDSVNTRDVTFCKLSMKYKF